MKKLLAVIPFLLAPILATLLTTSCEVDSASDVAPVPSSDGQAINVNGVYRNSDATQNNGVFIDPANSGARITQLNIRQNGNNLEGVANGNQVFRGTIGAISGSSASFNLSGSTSAGNSANISGTIEVQPGGKGVMRATWIEADRYCNLYGIADGPTINTNTPPLTNGTNGASFRIGLTPMEAEKLLAIFNGESDRPHFWTNI